jgi:hypothetical protein
LVRNPFLGGFGRFGLIQPIPHGWVGNISTCPFVGRAFAGKSSNINNNSTKIKQNMCHDT